MEGLYLYCLREKIKNSPAISAEGIDGKGEVFTLPFRKLEAVVSKISLEEFGSSEIQKKAQENLSWIKEKALIHEKVIEEAMRKNGKVLSPIPMRFGIIFKEEAKLKETLSKDYSRIKEVLERIEGKQEWSVKLYLKDRKKLEQEIKKGNKIIKEKEKEIASLPEGMGYFMEEELKEVISEEVEKKLANIQNLIFENLKKHTAESVKNKILGKELTGRLEPMILNVSYLIPEKKVKDFKEEAEELNQKMQAKGLDLEYTGPWPAYNFSSY